MARVSNLRIDDGLLQFKFTPSIGIVAARIGTFGLGIKDFREPLRMAIKEVMIPSFKANFDQGGRPDPWEPWSDATVEIMSNMGVGGTLMKRSGNLEAATQSMDIWTITPTSASIRSLPQTVWYSYLHQGGFTVNMPNKRAGKTATIAGVSFSPSSFDIPARPFIMVQDQDYDRIERVFSKWLDKKLLQAGWLG